MENLLPKAYELAQKGDFAHARNLCKKILRNDPKQAEAYYLAGSISLLLKDYDAAKKELEEAVNLLPSHADSLNNLGLVFLERDRDYVAAEKYLKQAIQTNPKHFNALMNLGNVYFRQFQHEQAEHYYHKALAINSNNASILNNLGAICVRKEEREKAIEFYRSALALAPSDPEILSNLIVSLKAVDDKPGVIELMHKILELKDPGAAIFPVFAFAKMFCLWDISKRALVVVMQLIHDGNAVLSSFESINLCLLASPEITNEKLFELHRIAGKTVEALREGAPYTSHPKAMKKSQRWRIGYLSPDFRQHAVNTFFRSLVNMRDRSKFEIYCYSSTKKEDDITEEYKAAADVFVNINNLSDVQLADRIHNDGIHILVDLAGYTHNSRTFVMGYKPAPVQMMYLGYPYTSGLETVDYFVSDPYLDGQNNSQYFSEKQLRLPECFIAFDHLYEQPIVEGSPFQRNGFVTFGSMNNLYKITPELISVWARILKRVTSARLIINHPNCDLEATRNSIEREFEKHEIDLQRVRLIWEKHPRGGHLHYYNDFDIMLDTFPLTGGTTTIDAVWMGVPVITLVGDVYHQRLSYTVLKNIDLDNVDDLIATTVEEYVEKSVTLAQNPDQIEYLHKNIPIRLKKSILCDSHRLTQHMEQAYIQAWQKKYPNNPIQTNFSDQEEWVSVTEKLKIAVSSSLEDLDAYVIREQQKAIDAEYHFFISIAKGAETAVDIDARYGIYLLPLATHIVDRTVYAVCYAAQHRSLLKKSLTQNGLHNVQLLESEHALVSTTQSTRIDLIRIGLDVSDIPTLKNWLNATTMHCSPLIMFPIRDNEAQFNSVWIDFFTGCGLELYRFVPGLNSVVPFSLEEPIDPFLLNLFCCNSERAKILAAHGQLVQQVVPLSEIPTITNTAWQSYLSSFPYAATLLEDWVITPWQASEWEVYWVALNLYVQAQQKSSSLEQRFAGLQGCYSMLAMLAEVHPTLPRLLSFARVAAELGKRELAVTLLEHLLQVFRNSTTLDLHEPFLAVSREHAEIAPEEKVAEWLYASVLEAREILRAHSSYFLDADALGFLNEVDAIGFATNEAKRRLTVMKKRFSE